MTYQFVTLEPAALELRRSRLDLAGFHAWLCPIVILVAIYISRQLLAPSGTRQELNASKRVSQRPSRLRLLPPSISRILSTTFIPEFGPLHVQLLGLTYSAWLLYLVFRGTGNDYLHLTKSFGHVAISQLPLQYLLSLKSPRSPVTLATGLTYERLNAYHRLLGRIVHLLLTAHATLYLRFFVLADLLGKRIKDRDVRLGLVAFWSFHVLALLALPPFRKFYRQLFYRSHVVISALVIPILFFHVSYTRLYVLQAGVFWILSCYTRRASRW